jgi:SulP family sulfate permease
VTVLNIYGSLFFARARILLEALPSLGATWSVGVLLLRGRTQAGATLIKVPDSYADDRHRHLDAVGGSMS